MSALRLVTAAVTLLALAAAAETPLELSKAMIGTWNGQIFGGRSIREGLELRTLVIKTVQWKEGEWVVDAEFGQTGKRLRRVKVTMEIVQDEPMLEFMTERGRVVRLHLVRSERAWVGMIGPKGRPMDIRLEKAGP